MNCKNCYHKTQAHCFNPLSYGFAKDKGYEVVTCYDFSLRSLGLQVLRGRKVCLICILCFLLC